MGDPGYVPRLQIRALLERQGAQPALDIRKPHAVGAADGHTSLGRDAPEPLGQRGIVRRVLEPAREHDDTPRAAAGRLLHLPLQPPVANSK